MVQRLNQDRRKARYSILEQDTHPLLANFGRHRSGLTNAELLDVSRQGARLVVDPQVLLDAQYLLTLSVESLSLDDTQIAHIRWWDVIDVGRWVVGCEFANAIPVWKLNRLVDHGVICRRNTARVDMRHHVALRRQLVPTPISGMLVKISESGSRLTTATEIEVDERILITTEDGLQPDFVVCRVVWSVRGTDHFTIDCEFESEGACDRLLRTCSRNSNRVRGQRRREANAVFRT